MNAVGALANVISGSILLGLAWRSSDRDTRRFWQWSTWLLGSVAFAVGTAALGTAFGP